MIIVLFGPPGVGKGTQSNLLVNKMNMHQLSTGDLFRHAISNSTELGVKAKSYIDKGDLVPDDVVVGMVEEAVIKNRDKDIIFDGFPRTKSQAESLDRLLDRNGLNIKCVVSIEVPEDVLVARLTGRRICKNCGALYHVDSKPSKKEGVCDECGGPLFQRSDDKESVIVNRLSTYFESTAPVLEYYSETSGLVKSIDGSQPPEDVFQTIVGLIER